MPAIPKPKRKPQGNRFHARRDPAYRAWIHTQPCLLYVAWTRGGYWHACAGPLEGCHVHSRGAGGDDDDNLVAMCQTAHREQRRLGIRSFQARWGVDLKQEAERLYVLYQRSDAGSGSETS